MSRDSLFHHSGTTELENFAWDLLLFGALLFSTPAITFVGRVQWGRAVVELDEEDQVGWCC